jgi:ATP-dependent Clp protease adaptor protein ClpS
MTKGAPSPEGNRKNYDHEKSLLLVNDELNTFEHVISSLVDVCGHDELQAEQCAFLTHHKGGCVIKMGDAVTLEKMSLRLKELNIDTVVL